MTAEKDFLGWIVDVARRTGWTCWHVPAPMRALPGGRGFVGAREAAGLCDLILIHTDPPRLILAEVKGPTGKLSDKQREFLRLARAVGLAAFDEDGRKVVGAYSWRPGVEGLIETILKGKVLA